MKTEKRLKQIRNRLNRATPGPWKKCTAHKGKCPCTSIWSVPDDIPIIEVTSGKWGDEFPALRFADGDSQGTIGAKIEAYTEMIEYGEIPDKEAQANKDFIANAPQDIAFLLELLENRK